MAASPLLHPIDEEALEEGELREGAPIERTERVPCTIALAKVHVCGKSAGQVPTGVLRGRQAAAGPPQLPKRA